MISYDSDFIEEKLIKPRIAVVGIGGAGGNALNTVVRNNIKNINCIAINTDAQALENVNAEIKLQLGNSIAQGMGTGANPEIGRMAAEEDINLINDALTGCDIVFLIAGLGGGTGSGVLPVVSRILQEKQILSISIVTKPFLFEGARRMNVAQAALSKIEEYSDTLIVIPNQKLFDANNHEDISLSDAFEMVNKVIVDCIKAVSETIYSAGHINVDFADIKATMTRMGKAVIGIGTGEGEDRAKIAMENVLSSPLLEHSSLKGARSILLNISGGKSLSLSEMNIIAGYVHDQVHPDAHIIVGTTLSESDSNEISLTLIATGFEDQLKTRNSPRNNFYNSSTPNFGYNNQQRMNSHYNNYSNNNSSQNKNNLNFENNSFQNSGNQTYQNSSDSNASGLDVPTFLRKNSIDQQIK